MLLTCQLALIAATAAKAFCVMQAAWKACMGTAKGKSFNDAEQRSIDEWRKAGQAALSVFKSPPTLPKLPARGSSALAIGPGGPPVAAAAAASSPLAIGPGKPQAAAAGTRSSMGIGPGAAVAAAASPLAVGPGAPRAR